MSNTTFSHSDAIATCKDVSDFVPQTTYVDTYLGIHGKLVLPCLSTNNLIVPKTWSFLYRRVILATSLSIEAISGRHNADPSFSPTTESS